MRNILVAEDQQELNDLIKEILQAEGHNVFQAYNGREDIVSL